MSVYTQRSFFRPYLVVHALNLISEFLNKSKKALIYLASPEDTAENDRARLRHISIYCGNAIFGVIKTLFWIVISISMGLLLGQLN